MILNPMDVLTVHPVRKSGNQKQAFRDDVRSYVRSLGYESTVEKGSLGARNVVIGDPERAQYLVTAHYDTCAWMPVPNLITPCNFWTFLAYQLLLAVALLGIVFIVDVIAYLLTWNDLIAMWAGYLALLAVIFLMIAGPANKHNANDNTSGVVTVLEMIRSLPENCRGKVCFVLFDLEEAGLIGSSSYRKKHKAATQNQLVLNLDCVGDGDDIVFFPTKKLLKDVEKLSRLRRACGTCGRKQVWIREKGFSMYPSDQTNFPYGVGIAALNRTKNNILYCGRIHTHKDTVLEQTNVNILRAGLITLITGPAVE